MICPRALDSPSGLCRPWPCKEHSSLIQALQLGHRSHTVSERLAARNCVSFTSFLPQPEILHKMVAENMSECPVF